MTTVHRGLPRIALAALARADCGGQPADEAGGEGGDVRVPRLANANHAPAELTAPAREVDRPSHRRLRIESTRRWKVDGDGALRLSDIEPSGRGRRLRVRERAVGARAMTRAPGLALALAALAAGAAGCGARAADKAGGVAKVERRALTLAYGTGAPPQLDVFADAVRRASGGALRIGYREGWRRGQPDFEAATVRDVAAGRLDLAAVGARAFDRLGVDSFQPLLAPMLVDSYALERRVFDAGIPQRMLREVERAGVVGVAVLPGPMRKLLGVSRPFRRPADFRGAVVGFQDSAIAETTLTALGARPRPVPAEARLSGLDGYEQQLGSITGNDYDRHARSVTADLNLWPRPLVIVMNPKAHAALTGAQRRSLARAARAAVGPAVAAARTEDDEARAVLCDHGTTLERADTAALRRAVAGVVPARPEVGEIRRLKAEVAAAPESPRCDGARRTSDGGTRATTLPRGTFETTITARDADGDQALTGRFRMTISAREVTIGEVGGDPEFRGAYSVYRDRVVVRAPEDTVGARFTYGRGRLRFTDVKAPRPYVVTWGAHPWHEVDVHASPLDGRYAFTLTKADLLAVGFHDLVLENFGRHRWTLRAGKFRMQQRNGPSDTWTTGTFAVRGHRLTLRVADSGGQAPNGTGPDGWLARPGEIWTYRWSLYRDTLTMHAVPGAVSPEPYRATPWRRQR